MVIYLDQSNISNENVGKGFPSLVFPDFPSLISGIYRIVGFALLNGIDCGRFISNPNNLNTTLKGL